MYSENKFKIVLCEIFNAEMHGFNKDSDPDVKNHFLSIYVVKKYTNLDKLYDIAKLYNLNNSIHISNHAFIRNYNNIISDKNYIKPEIGEVITLNGGEIVVIIKTFWLKIVQRLWKKVFEQRKKVIAKRMHIKSILYKETNGKWPQDCIYLPSIKGMFI